MNGEEKLREFRKIEIKRYHRKWGQDTRTRYTTIVDMECSHPVSERLSRSTVNASCLFNKRLALCTVRLHFFYISVSGMALFHRQNTFPNYELPRTMNDFRDSGRGRASIWSIRTYWRITNRHMYCNGSTSENRDTGLVSRTGYEGDPGERDLTSNL